ncbi:M14-type cytosolic carboxypeptidase [Erythrobacter westpacificensis]|uniref:M14-type cytosolic carboxypeptidase n=2 Tax=Erythrobacter westpacificensis TaxID=1055231 RepID=A0ABP9KHQ5_9SPHN
MRTLFLASLAGSLLLASCATPHDATSVASLPASALKSARCASNLLAVDTDFPAGALASCTVSDGTNIAITIAPEDEPPINPSPWYAFRVTPAAPTEMKLSLSYTEHGHRYWPKISYDGVTWTYLDQGQVKVSELAGSKMARIALESDGRPFFISAQEIVVPATYDKWLGKLERHADASRSVLGQSAEGRDIPLLTIADPFSQQRESIVLVGRQHPPEVSGALAMFPFVEELLADNDLARRFRARFQTVVVPMLNPDGVVRGHWRHATGGVDLNRDWGKFCQPETRLMGDMIAAIEADPARNLTFFLDFHSTQKDVVYTLSKDIETDPPGFTDAWLADYQARVPNYEVVEEPGYSAGRGVSKNWIYDEYGVPTATFELGDETDRELVKTLGTAAARAMMKTLLETESE